MSQVVSTGLSPRLIHMLSSSRFSLVPSLPVETVAACLSLAHLGVFLLLMGLFLQLPVSQQRMYRCDIFYSTSQHIALCLILQLHPCISQVAQLTAVFALSVTLLSCHSNMSWCACTEACLACCAPPIMPLAV